MASVIVSYRVTVVTRQALDELFELETVVAHAVDEEHDVNGIIITFFTFVLSLGVNVFAVDLAPVAVVQGVSLDGRECLHGKSEVSVENVAKGVNTTGGWRGAKSNSTG